jgi:hypothetical protein
MPKDATKNVDRYKIRGGTLNEYEFQQGKTADKKQKAGYMKATDNKAADTNAADTKAADKKPQKPTAKKGSKKK